MSDKQSAGGDRRRFDHKTRSAARLAAVQALYQMELAGRGADAVIQEFSTFRFGQNSDDGERSDADEGHFAEIVRGVTAQQGAIDKAIENRLAEGWTLARLDSILRALLRAASFELLYKPATPRAVAINEYVDVAHAFFDGDEPRFVNAVLDAVADDQAQALSGG